MQESLRSTSKMNNLTGSGSHDTGVCFDSENTVLKGYYCDEISAYRARKLWVEALEYNFLLEHGQDFQISIEGVPELQLFMLNCNFLTACARYAFWRITNNQAPEVQYVIETAHIPLCESRHEDILRAPDLRPITEEPAVINNITGTELNNMETRSIFRKMLAYFGSIEEHSQDN